jgi:hypothetical protein
MSAHQAPITTPGQDRPAEQQPAPEPPRPQPAQQPTPAVEQQPAPAPAVPFAPRGRLQRPQRDAAPGVSSLLDMVAYAPWMKNENLSLSTFVPDANALYVALDFCDINMRSTDRFTRGHHQWNPYVSRIYIGMLFYFRIMDCMVLAGIAEDDILTLLQRIKTAFDFRRLSIPGPLVPYFQSLSVCSSGHSLLGDVTPTLPELSSVTKKNFWSFGNARVPNIPALMDALRLPLDAAAPDVNDYDELPHVYTNLHNVTVTDDISAHAAYAVGSCGFGRTTHASPNTNATFRRAATLLNLPQRLTQSQAAIQSSPMTWYQFLRFRRLTGEQPQTAFSEWFANVAAVMRDYSSYFRDSSNLGSIPIAAGGAPHVLSSYANTQDELQTPPNPARLIKATTDKAAYFRLFSVGSLQTTALVRVENLPDVHLQIGTLALTNAENDTINVIHRHGNAWQQNPVVLSMSPFDTFGNLPSYIGSLHSSRAIE